MSQKQSRIGAIGEHMVAAQLMLQGFDAINANLSITNMEGIDLLCVNDKQETAFVQVKTTEKAGGFPVGMSIGQAADRKYVDSHVLGPWVFVRKLGDFPNATFKYYILSRQQVVDMIFESNDWYVNKLQHSQPISSSGTCAIQEDWLTGKDCSSPRLIGPTFINPLKGISSENAWDNIWK